MSKPNNAGMVSFDVCNINALYLEGQRFQNLDQAEMDLIIANLDAIVSNATKITALEAADVVINTAISALQTTDISQNTAITNLQTSDTTQNNKIQYWNADGTVYNNGGIDATEIYANPLQIGDTDVGNFIKLGVDGDVGIRLESVNHELVEVAPTIIIRGQDTTNHNEHIDIGLGYGNVAVNGKTEVNIGSGQSTVNICAKQSSSSIADGAKIYIGVKQNVDADSDIYVRGNFHSEDCQMVTLDVTNSITWGTLIAQAAFIPFMPGLILSSIFGPTVQFSYSDLIHLTSSKFMESTNSPNLNGISVFDSSITSTVFPAINFLSLFGSITNWTGAGNIELTALAGEVLQKVGDNSTSTYNYTKVKTNGIDIYSKADTINLISNGNGMVKILHGSDLLLHNTSDGNGKYIHIKDKLKITNGTFSPPYTTEITDALVASYASLFTVGNIATVNSTKLTFDNVNASTTTNSLYRDANSNLFWNGRNISNYTAGTASTYILSISANITSPPASNGTLNLTYTSTPLYYINYTGYAVATELEVGTFTSPNVDLIANPFISSGLWSFNYHTTVTANVEVRSYFKVYIQETVTATNTSTTTLLKDGSSNYVVLTPNGTLGTYALTYNELYIDYYQFPNLTTCTYKVIIKAYIYQPSGTTSHNVRFGFNDTALSHVHTTFQNVSATSTLQNVLLAGNTAGSTPINMNGQAIQNASDILPQSNNDLVVGSKASSTGKTYIYANAQPRITVSNTGNVGVGSANTSPAYLLDASGGAVNCSELRINGVVQSFSGTLAQTLTQGNTANTSINMANNNITNFNTISANPSIATGVIQGTGNGTGLTIKAGPTILGSTLQIQAQTIDLQATDNDVRFNGFTVALPLCIRTWGWQPTAVSFGSTYSRNSFEFVVSESSWDLDNYMYIIRFSCIQSYNYQGTGGFIKYSINNTPESSSYNGRNLLSYHNVSSVSGVYSNQQDNLANLIYVPNTNTITGCIGDIEIRKYTHFFGGTSTSSAGRLSVKAYFNTSYAQQSGVYQAFEGGTTHAEYFISELDTFSLTSFKLWGQKTNWFNSTNMGSQTGFTASLTKVPL